MQVYYSDDLSEGQRSSEVECGKICDIVIKLRRIPDANLMIMTFMKLKGHQRLNLLNFNDHFH